MSEAGRTNVQAQDETSSSRLPIRESHTINLIDTPGHADFTFEVIRSLRILDGAVCILDGVAGVEAQTEKVWYQAANHKIPKIIYINKLDRDGAAFGKTVKEIASRLFTWPAVCQIPWYDQSTDRHKGNFVGLGDAVELQCLRWAGRDDGKSIRVIKLNDLASIDKRLYEELRKARVALVELLSENDDYMVEKYLECNEDHLAISPADIRKSIRRCLLDGASTITPVFAGSSFQNIGIQPLLDRVVDLLPSPSEISDPEVKISGMHIGLKDLTEKNGLPSSIAPKSGSKGRVVGSKGIFSLQGNIGALALAFKVVNNPKSGVLVYVRVYYGTIESNAMLYNTNLQSSERAPKLFRMYAADAVEVPSINSGQIGVIRGLKYARTGDTLIAYTGTSPKSGIPAPWNTLQLRPIDVPSPVFFASVEPQSLSEQESISNALALLLREDPSLRVTVDDDSGQTLLSGMGELHLEIAQDRLINDLKAKASMGKIEIEYRECIMAPSSVQRAVFDREIAGKMGQAGCSVTVIPWSDDMETTSVMDGTESMLKSNGNMIVTKIKQNQHDSSEEQKGLPLGLTHDFFHTPLRNGALAALARGPQHRFPMQNTQVSILFDLTSDFFGMHTTPAALLTAARIATQRALKDSAQAIDTVLMEPVMNAVITCTEATLGGVVHDISAARGGHIVSLDDTDAMSTSDDRTREEAQLIDIRRVYAPPDPFASSVAVGNEEGMPSQTNRARSITARIPLKEMVGYLKHLRSLTAGRGSFTMSLDRFERMNGLRQKAVLKEIRGSY